LKILDFQKIKRSERELAEKMFGVAKLGLAEGGENNFA
jgi:hypothetical protein